MLGKLEIITKGYTDLEATLNDAIFKTVDSGYYNIRKMTQKDYMDLEQSIKSFNTAGTSEERSIALNNFIAVNKYLEATGKVKVLPWDSYRTNLADNFFSENLVKKRVTDAEGKVTLENYTTEELNTVLGENKTLESIIKENINQTIGKLPINPLDVNLIITQYNAEINANNEALRREIEKVQNSDKSLEDKQKEIDFYTKSISNHVIAPISESKSIKAYDAIHLAKHEAKVRDVVKTYEADIEKYLEKLNLKSIYQNEDGYVSFDSLLRSHGAKDGD